MKSVAWLAVAFAVGLAIGCGTGATVQGDDPPRNIQTQLRVAHCNWAPPSTASCCQSCSGQSCQPNGCYGGWWCDPSACVCGSPPSGCGTGGDAGTGGNNCSHPICQAGAKLVGSCDPCAGAICGQDSYCCSVKWDSQCVGEVTSICGQSCGVCTPQCAGKQCGSDGCGGSCGSCPSGETCSASGQCQTTCTPQCTGKQCGSDGCGGSCGTCASGETCDANGQCQTTCTPQCTGKQCGSDGCGGSCGNCPSGETCNASGQCTTTCTPQCTGKQCGPDGCGGSCGNCPSGETCNASGQCQTTCTPQCTGKQCGPDGCGGSCGTCPSGETCNASGQCASGGTGVGPNGGTVPSLYFAVVGDTRPSSNNDTANYPTAIITKIYQDLNALNPKPQFILTTGDYMFADPNTTNGPAQLQLYMQAESNWTGGPVFHAMGNHECNGFTASNMDLSNGTCDGVFSNNYQAFFTNMVQPLGKTLPYYSIPISATDGSWTSKFINVACNAWDSTQQSWLQSQLAQSTTYTFVFRHEDYTATTGPCVNSVNSMLSSAKYDVLITGHSHTFANNYSGAGKEIIVGNGGAGSGGTYGYGYATFNQSGSSFTVTDYDYSTGSPKTSFVVQ